MLGTSTGSQDTAAMAVKDPSASAAVAAAALLAALAVLPDTLVVLAALWILREITFRPTVTERTPAPGAPRPAPPTPPARSLTPVLALAQAGPPR